MSSAVMRAGMKELAKVVAVVIAADLAFWLISTALMHWVGRP